MKVPKILTSQEEKRQERHPGPMAIATGGAGGKFPHCTKDGEGTGAEKLAVKSGNCEDLQVQGTRFEKGGGIQNISSCTNYRAPKAEIGQRIKRKEVHLFGRMCGSWGAGKG